MCTFFHVAFIYIDNTIKNEIRYVWKIKNFVMDLVKQIEGVHISVYFLIYLTYSI